MGDELSVAHRHEQTSCSQYSEQATDCTVQSANSDRGKMFFSKAVSVGHPVSYSAGTGAFSPGLRRPGREYRHCPQSRVENKNAWSYTSTPVRLLTRARDNFALYSKECVVIQSAGGFNVLFCVRCR